MEADHAVMNILSAVLTLLDAPAARCFAVNGSAIRRVPAELCLALWGYIRGFNNSLATLKGLAASMEPG